MKSFLPAALFLAACTTSAPTNPEPDEVATGADFSVALEVPAETTPQGTPTEEPEPALRPNLVPLVVDRAGNEVDLETITSASDIYLSVKPADAAKEVVSQDFMFQVVDRDGAVKSIDGADCRIFHVDARGSIDIAYMNSASTCQRRTVQLADGRFLIALAPLHEVAKDDSGAMHYTLNIEALATCGDDNEFDEACSVDFSILSCTGDDH